MDLVTLISLILFYAAGAFLMAAVLMNPVDQLRAGDYRIIALWPYYLGVFLAHQLRVSTRRRRALRLKHEPHR